MFAMLNLVLIENEPDQVHIFQYIYFKSVQIHLQELMYHFERRNHDNNHDFKFQIFSHFFCIFIINICNILQV